MAIQIADKVAVVAVMLGQADGEGVLKVDYHIFLDITNKHNFQKEIKQTFQQLLIYVEFDQCKISLVVDLLGSDAGRPFRMPHGTTGKNKIIDNALYFCSKVQNN